MKVRELFKGDKKPGPGIYILLAAGIALLLLSSFSGGEEAPDRPAADAEEPNYISALENRLEETLSAIEGAGEVRLTLVPRDRGSVDVGKDGSGESSRTVMVSGQSGSQALIVAEKYPAVQGAIVVARGAGSDRVRADLAEAVSTALGIGVHRVKVYKMRN